MHFRLHTRIHKNTESWLRLCHKIGSLLHVFCMHESRFSQRGNVDCSSDAPGSDCDIDLHNLVREGTKFSIRDESSEKYLLFWVRKRIEDECQRLTTTPPYREVDKCGSYFVFIVLICENLAVPSQLVQAIAFRSTMRRKNFRAKISE